MKFRSTRKWSDPLELRGLLYFAQRLEELTFEYTLDSYRTPAVSLPFLIEEARDQVDLCIESGLGQGSIPHLIKEIEQRFSQSPIAKNLTRFPIETFTQYDNDQLKKLRSFLSVLYGEIQPRAYSLKGFQLLKEACDSNEKGEIELIAREVSATLCNMGVSKQHQYRSTVSHFFSGKEITDKNSLDEFVRVVFPHTHKFNVVLKVHGPIKTLSSDFRRQLRVSILAELPKGALQNSSQSFKNLSDGQLYVSVTEVKATDPFTALKTAKAKVEQMFNLFGLFHHKLDYEIEDEGHASQKCCNEDSGIFRIQSDLMQFVDDNRPAAAAKKMQGFLRDISIPEGKDRQKFFQTIELHGLSSNTRSMENQLLNIWSCMETFAPTRNDKSIIDSVVAGLMPCFGLTYYQRILKRAANDLSRWKPHIFRQIGFNDEELRTKTKEIVTLELLTLATREGSLNDLLTRCDNFELMRYRIYTLAMLFRSKRRLNTRLREHQQRVEWQLRRIYRARNEIIHRGRSPQYTDSLVINAHDYFDQCFFCICGFLSGTNAQQTLSGAFDLAEMTFNQYLSELHDISTKPVYSDLEKILWKAKKSPNIDDFF